VNVPANINLEYSMSNYQHWVTWVESRRIAASGDGTLK